MQIGPIVTFRNVRASDGLIADVRRRIAKLETYYQPITSCRVQVAILDRHRLDGSRYRVRIDLTVPGSEIVVSHDASSRRRLTTEAGSRRTTKKLEPEPEHKYAKVAIREAFDVARRQLQDFARRQRGAVKTHRPRGRAPRAD